MKLARAAVVFVAAGALLVACGVHVPTPTPSTGTTVAPGNPPPKKRHTGPGTVSGKILRFSKPVAGASVQVVAWPKGAVLGKLGKGQKVPTKRLGRDSSASDGTYSVKLAKSRGRYRDGRVVNVEIDVFAPAGASEWDVSLRLIHNGKHNSQHNGKTRPLHLTFDLGRSTVMVGGHKAHTRVVH